MSHAKMIVLEMNEENKIKMLINIFLNIISKTYIYTPKNIFK